jgi:anaerobic selenocysteine-containing dehydrogenase
MNAGDTTVVRTMCPMNCHPTFCGMLVEVEGGKLNAVSGDKDNPDSQGFLCVRGRSTNEIFGNPKRLLYPQIRDDRRTNAWRRVSWDKALDFIVDRMQTVGPGAVGLWAAMAALRGWRGHSSDDATLLQYLRLSGMAPSNDLLGARRVRRRPDGRSQGQHERGYG